MSVIKYNEPKYKFDIGVSKGGHVGIWMSFLQMLGLGGDLNVEGSNERGEEWTCENMQTISFMPKLAYITKCLEDEGVQNYMRVNKPWFGTSRLYMITGIKVAYGAASTSQEGADPFVFAFRLRRIKISGKGRVGHEQYDKGTVLSIKKDGGGDAKLKFVVEGVEDDDALGSAFQLDSKAAVDEASQEDTTCSCALSED
ncbi:hypothetical protein FZEAL_332 [Fusarium zealandicum]|uniref:Uncharacterized protein n=1 Tax=Fusarium zealandicum TaxID=1053134 RepID=A0A8H4UV40_9HYPO|nr:hypothetical protein FZEAL_332 [Fusarium zealandicum]